MPIWQLVQISTTDNYYRYFFFPLTFVQRNQLSIKFLSSHSGSIVFAWNCSSKYLTFHLTFMYRVNFVILFFEASHKGVKV